jgi:hypothetical protein
MMEGFALIPYLIVCVVVIIPFWKIFEKLGYPAALSLLTLIPVANLAVLYYVAFAKPPRG